MAIIADNDGVVELARRVGKTCELDPLLIEVLITVACLCLPLKSQVIEEKISVHATAREAHIIRVPLYAAHFDWLADLIAAHQTPRVVIVRVVLNRVIIKATFHIDVVCRLFEGALFTLG